eukprot:206918-Amphidinium_carterae.1
MAGVMCDGTLDVQRHNTAVVCDALATTRFMWAKRAVHSLPAPLARNLPGEGAAAGELSHRGLG